MDNKDYADRLLRQALEALTAAGEELVPDVGHSCTPESFCDSLCVEAAYIIERNWKVRQAIKAINKYFKEVGS